MFTTAEGKVYLNQQESIEFLQTVFATFQTIKKRYELQAYKFPTQPRSIFYLKSDLEKIRDTPVKIGPDEQL